LHSVIFEGSDKPVPLTRAVREMSKNVVVVLTHMPVKFAIPFPFLDWLSTWLAEKCVHWSMHVFVQDRVTRHALLRIISTSSSISAIFCQRMPRGFTKPMRLVLPT